MYNQPFSKPQGRILRAGSRGGRLYALLTLAIASFEVYCSLPCGARFAYVRILFLASDSGILSSLSWHASQKPTTFLFPSWAFANAWDNH